MDQQLLSELQKMLADDKPHKEEVTYREIVTVKGDNGKDGVEGKQGPKGEKGDKGIDGIDGIEGKQGPKGDNGKDGVIPDYINWSEEDISKISRRHAANISALYGLSDVDATTAVNGSSLVYNSTTSRWEASVGIPTSWGSITGNLADQVDLQNALDGKQDLLVSGTNIKTINGVSILGSGDIPLPNGTSINNVSTDTVISLTDGVIMYLVDCTAGNVNITLPTATANTGQYTVSKIDSSTNVVNIVGVINNQTNPTLDFQDECYTLVSNGVTYKII